MKIAGKDPNGNAKGVAVTENGEVKVQQTGSNVSVEKLIDKETIAVGSYINVSLNLNGQEKEVYILLWNDVNPIRILGSNYIGAWSNISDKDPQKYNFFPVGDITTNLGEYASNYPESIPAPFYYFPNGLSYKENFDDFPTTYEEAKKNTLGYNSNAKVRIVNDAASILTVSLWVVKIYG